MRTQNARTISLSTFAAMLLAPLLADAQMIQAPGAPATGPYLDTNSGMTFPVTAGEFKRFRVTRAGPREINAGYVDPNPAAKLSAIVFVERPTSEPGVDLCRKMADAERDGAKKTHSDAVISDLTAPSASDYSSVAFSSRYNDPGGRGTTDNYYYCDGGPWMVEYMFQHVTAFDAAALEAGLMRDVKLTVGQKP